ncbi:MAG: histidine phosphatase family protein [Rhodobacterales bacterium]|nr:histidine phosphatase family protein [Rhodobacterales bacterium]
MSQITLVRHGQAQTQAKDEQSYDQLSDLGHTQATWLGQHLVELGEEFDHVFCGTLRRHRETADSMQAASHATIIEDARLNELEYFGLAQKMETQHGLPIPNEREGFLTHLPTVFSAWEQGIIADPVETFEEFETRVGEMLQTFRTLDGRVLVITSGGWIGNFMRQTLGLDMHGFSRICLSIKNTSLHQWTPLGDTLALTHFNGVPHLDRRDRQYAQTYL